MGLQINLNIASLIARKNLSMISRKLEKTYGQVASGEKINKAGDDAAGLAISQLMRSQIQSMQKAIQNTGDGLSVINTAESALDSIQNTVQRIRELAIQASNGSNSDAQRVSIQDEITQLIEEVNRLANTTQFNGQNLLDGTYVDRRIQIGFDVNEFLPVSISDVRSAALGQQAIVTGSLPVTTAPLTGGGELIINGVTIGASSNDGISFVNADASALAKANAINRLSAQTGVLAEVEDAVFQVAGASISAVTLDGTTSAMYINGISIGPVDVQAGDSTGALVSAINLLTSQTGVEASIDAGGELVLSNSDGSNFQVTTTGSIADELGLATADGDLTAQVVSGRVTLRSSQQITVSGSNPGIIGLDGSQLLTLVDATTALANISVTTQDSAEDAISISDAAIEQISRIRATLGSITNRLENSITNAQTVMENLKSSDSRIRDTDFAEATAILTQQQILQEAATAILAQANLLPQAALQLLQQ